MKSSSSSSPSPPSPSSQHLPIAFVGVNLMATMAAILSGGICGMIIEDFYSHSFMPHLLQITYHIEHNSSIYYNVTALSSFPGKILFNLFIMNLPDERRSISSDDGPSANAQPQTVLKSRNLDFCKTLEALKNGSTDIFQDHSTFITSCPLMRGFYYIANVTPTNELSNLPGGHFLCQFELIQVYDEVIKLMNVKIKLYTDSQMEWEADDENSVTKAEAEVEAEVETEAATQSENAPDFDADDWYD